VIKKFAGIASLAGIAVLGMALTGSVAAAEENFGSPN
jgi:hypothetical protein